MARNSLTLVLVTFALAMILPITPVMALPGTPGAAPTDDHESQQTSRAPLAMLNGDVPWPTQMRAVGDDGDTPGDLPAHSRRNDLLPRVPPDEFLASLMDSVRLENVTGTIQRLQNFYTRYVVSDSCWSSAAWLARELESSGYTNVTYDTFRCWSYQDTVDAANLIAVKTGTTRPDEYVVIGGHYDSISTENFHDPDAYAPGADDNATGVAGVLEAARILAPIDLERSVIFALWSGEETGLRGSRAWVADAVAAEMDIVVYLNMDVIGYTDEDPPVAIVYSDSTSLAVGGLMKDLIINHTPYGCVTTVQPIGASDQNSFWEQGINVLDTSSGAGWSPYHHTPNDIIDHVDLELCRALAAVNVAATASLAGVPGEDENLPPETILANNCAAQHDTLGRAPRMEWSGVDFDGEVSGYEYCVTPPTDGLAHENGLSERTWLPLPADSTGITLTLEEDGPHTFEVRAIDNDGLADATPAVREFRVASWLAPRITVTPVFGMTTAVFENERLVFEVRASAEHYCAELNGVSWAVGDGSWSEWVDLNAEDGAGTRGDRETRSALEVVIRPALDDTIVVFRARDDHGATAADTIAFDVIVAPMSSPLLHVDDWFGQEMSEIEHDVVYDSLLANLPHDTWDPYQHIQGWEPQLPAMEDLGQYRTVIWTLGDGATLLRPAQAESGYHAIEGFVRAGGNLILEGHSTVEAFAALDAFTQDASFDPGDFVYDYAGIDSVHNAGSQSDPQVAETYGYAFLGGTSINPSTYPHAPVDTLGTWADGYAQHGGLPSCEVYRTAGAWRIHWFDAYLNDALDEKPCASLKRTDFGCGSVAVLGYPLCYIQREPARVLLSALVDDVVEWQQPAELFSVTWDEQRDYVFFLWYFAPPDHPQGARIERRVSGGGAFVPLGESLVTQDEDGRYRFIDTDVVPGATYDYRLVVTEVWGGQTTHGPWAVEVPTDLSIDRLSPPSPNPTAGETTILYTVADEHRWLRIGVYSVGGRLIKRLYNGPVGRGRHETTWDGRDGDGREAASGVYFIRADFGPRALERKVVLVR